MKKFNSPLENIKIASPCSADWNEMVGDSRKRFCGQCNLNVYNLSEMTRPEAEQFVANSEGGRLCVRMYQRQDGSIITQDCPVGWQAVKRRVSRIAAAGVSLVVGLFASLGLTAAVTQASSTKGLRFLPVLTTPTPPIMGGIAPSTPRPTPKPKTTPSPRVLMGDVAAPNPTPKKSPKPAQDDSALMGKVSVKN